MLANKATFLNSENLRQINSPKFRGLNDDSSGLAKIFLDSAQHHGVIICHFGSCTAGLWLILSNF